MGQGWLRALRDRPGIEVAGVIDLDTERAGRVVAEQGLPVPVGTSLDDVPAADVLVNATVPQAHLPVSLEALGRGMDVLCEKPAAPSVAEAMVMAAAAHSAQRLLMISQSRRYGRRVESFHAATREAFPAGPGLLVTEFFRAPRFGGYREEMAHVLLVDMAIHAFDIARFVLGSDPVSVYCDESNQPWSWFRDGASATAIFEFAEATRYVFTGSWIASGAQTSWNGRWRAVGNGGTVSWDGDGDPEVEAADVSPATTPPAGGREPGSGGEGIDGALSTFHNALNTTTSPPGEVTENLGSLAMVEAAVRSAQTGTRVLIDDVLAEARTQAAVLSGEHGLAQAWRQWSTTPADGARQPSTTPADGVS